MAEDERTPLEDEHTVARRPTMIHLVPHTHWDREWYRPFQSFRVQLVDLVDRVLDMLDSDEEFAFTLDGQLATIDDYLEIRPSQAERVAAHVSSGRLAIGPWQILMDEFLVGGETLVRNLERGWQRAEAFGGPMRVGYLPDMFGHVAQMPQILRRAGLADAVVWRGVPAAMTQHAFRWESPDGSWVRAEYLAAGYGNAAYLFAVPARLDVAAQRFLDSSVPWFDGDAVLAMYGTDHTAPIPDLATLVRGVNDMHDAAAMRISTLPQYLDAMPDLTDEAPCWRGEMRSGARANVLMGVTSARIDIKQAAGRAEGLLERYAEPLSALHLMPAAWPEEFLRLAWSKVIENSAHDSICGCSVDPVANQVLVRFAEAQQIADTLAQRAAMRVAEIVPRGAVAVLNPTPAVRDAVIDVELPIPDEWSAVAMELPDGSRVGTQEVSRKEPILLETTIRGGEVDDIFVRFHGREVFGHQWNGYRIEDRTVTLEVDDDPEPLWLDVDDFREHVTSAMRAYPDDAWTVRIVARPRRALAAWITAPALGWTVLKPVAAEGQVRDPVRVEHDGRSMTNGLLTILVEDDGTLRLESPAGSIKGVGRIVDGGDYGDSYNYAPPASDTLLQVPTMVAVEAGPPGPVRASLTIRRTYPWPAGVLPDGSARSPETEPTEVRTRVELRAGEPFARLAVSFTNQARDHRVRFHAPLLRRATASHAEGQFAVVERGMIGEGGHREEPLATYPAHGWVDAGGLAVLLDHVVEYELTDGGRELALTLLRSIGLISRNDNPYREDPAGPEIAIPGAQMLGSSRMTFGLYPHAGGWAEGGVVEAAERYRLGFVTAAGTALIDGGPEDLEGAGEDAMALGGKGVVMTSLRRRPAGWLEVRLVNLEPRPTVATLAGGLLEAREVSLRGEAGATIDLEDGGDLRVEIGGAEIRTIQIRRRETSAGRPERLDATRPRPSAWPTR